MRLRRRNIAGPTIGDECRAAHNAVKEPEPKERRHFQVQPRFSLFGPTMVTDDDGYVDVDISWVPSGVVEIQLKSGGGIVTYPFDIDGHRVRNPEAKSVKLRWTME